MKMSQKLIPAALAVAALLIGSTAMASAQTSANRPFAPSYTQNPAPRGAYASDPNAGTIWYNVAPYGSDQAANPYAGTIWDGVAPY
jgi:hypothetical protein